MAQNNAEVKMVYITRANWNSLTTKDQNTLYFVVDTSGNVTQYLGNTQIFQNDYAAKVPGPTLLSSDNASGNVTRQITLAGNQLSYDMYILQVNINGLNVQTGLTKNSFGNISGLVANEYYEISEFVAPFVFIVTNNSSNIIYLNAMSGVDIFNWTLHGINFG